MTHVLIDWGSIALVFAGLLSAYGLMRLAVGVLMAVLSRLEAK